MGMTFLPFFPGAPKSSTRAPTPRKRLYTVAREQRQRSASSANEKYACCSRSPEIDAFFRSTGPILHEVSASTSRNLASKPPLSMKPTK